MLYSAPGTEGSKVTVSAQYGNWINGQYSDPTTGEYADNPSPVTGRPFTRFAQSGAADIELALDAAHSAQPGWAAL